MIDYPAHEQERDAAAQRRHDAEFDVASLVDAVLTAGRSLDAEPKLRERVQAWREALAAERDADAASQRTAAALEADADWFPLPEAS